MTLITCSAETILNSQLRLEPKHDVSKPISVCSRTIGFDELAWELDQYIAHADLNDLEKIALAFMRTNSRTR
jgi:hypothetical protein